MLNLVLLDTDPETISEMKSLPLLSIKNALKNGPFGLLLNGGGGGIWLLNGGGGGIWSYSLAGNGNSAFCYEITSQTQKRSSLSSLAQPTKKCILSYTTQNKNGSNKC